MCEYEYEKERVREIERDDVVRLSKERTLQSQHPIAFT